MKKISFVLICVVILAACNKDQAVKTTVTVISSGPIDTFTLIDNGITYIDTQTSNNDIGAEIIVDKETTGSFFSMYATANNWFPISLNIEVGPGPVNGIGVYKMSPIDSTYNDNQFEEAYNGGEAYTLDSVTVNITVAAADTVFGSYQLWLSNVAGSKSVSGIIRCYHPR